MAGASTRRNPGVSFAALTRFFTILKLLQTLLQKIFLEGSYCIGTVRNCRHNLAKLLCTHISGHNLFVSAYHGFATLGHEHVPEPRPWEEFPVYALEFLSSEAVGEKDLRLRFRVTFEACPTPERYQILMKLQLTKPGGGKNPGLMRNFLAARPCTAGDSEVQFLIKDYRSIWDLDLPEYQAHCRYLLLDRKTGYRNIHTPLSFPVTA